MNEIIKADVCNELGKSWIDYAMSVNGDRANPDAKTGLKPVARRVLYDMWEQERSSNKPHVKAARIVGDTMGRFHPHGDSSIYEAMVRLSQPWIMRYPLISFHGNNGSQAGDGAASMRYTEARLTKIAEDGLLSNLKKENVDFIPNYDETEEEPLTLPAIFPNLLCNPNEGIGVAMATDLICHNLRDIGPRIISYLSDPTFDIINGLYPDFPTGATLINATEIPEIYKTGKGRVILRGKYREEFRDNKKLLVFYEIPYMVKIEKLLEQIAEAAEKDQVHGVDEVRNESDTDNLRVVIELSKTTDVDVVVQELYAYTSLQSNVTVGQVALVNKVPKMLTLKEMFDIYIEHNIDVIQREVRYDLNKAKERIEIVEGLLKAFENIDNIIALIKQSENTASAKTNLIDKYKFTERQAGAIVDMKLGRLARLEGVKLNQEKEELSGKIVEFQSILASDDKQKEELKQRLGKFIEKYGDERRTDVTNIEIKKNKSVKAKEKPVIIPEDVVVVINDKGEVKKIPQKTFKVQNRGGRGVKTNEIVKYMISTNTLDTLMVFTDLGKLYKYPVDSIPVGNNKTKGTSLRTIIEFEPNEKIVAATALNDEEGYKYALFTTQKGLVKKTDLSEYNSTRLRKGGIKVITFKEGDSLTSVNFVKDESDIILITRLGKAIHFMSNDIKATGKTSSGVKGINLDDEDYVVAALTFDRTYDYLTVVNKDGVGKKMPIDLFTVQLRGGKGLICSKAPLAGAVVVKQDEKIAIYTSTNSITIEVKDISELKSRDGLGVQLIKKEDMNDEIKIVKI